MSDLISRSALIKNKPEFMNEKVVRDTKYQTTKDRIYAKAWNDCNSYWLKIINNAPTVSIESCHECPFVADEEKQITNGDAWKSYCEGQEVGFKKAEYVFERMKIIQETVDCIRNTFKLDTERDKLVRNCMALVQNAIDGEYHDMEEVDVSKIEIPQGEWIEGENGNIKCNKCGCEIRYSYLIGNKSDFPKFCCDCGAYMRKEKDNER